MIVQFINGKSGKIVQALLPVLQKLQTQMASFGWTAIAIFITEPMIISKIITKNFS
jgi:hypothetical protein